MARHTQKLCVAAATLGMLLVSAPATAQGTSGIVKTKGFMVGAHINGSAVSTGDDNEGTIGTNTDKNESGAGGGVMVGWGFTKWFMLYGGVDAAKIKINGLSGFDDDDDPISGDYTFLHGDLGARFSFPSPNHGFVPYLNAALTTRVATAEVFDEDVSISGPGFTLGGGLQYFFTPKLALDVAVQFTAGKFNEVEVGAVKFDLDKLGADVDNTNSARVNIGMKFYPHFGGKK